MNAREQYQAACRNYRLHRMNAAHLASDRFDIPYYKRDAFVKVSPEMTEIGTRHVIMGSVINPAHYYNKNGQHDSRLFYLLRKARKG